MEIQKVFSNIEDSEENLYSVLMSEDEIALFSEYMPQLTRYDRSDRLKQMKDADVLAEKKRSNMGTYVKTAKTTGVGAVLGSGIGAVAGAMMGRKKGNILGGLKAGAKTGAVLGAGAGAIGGLASTHKEREQNRFVNRRLGEAQRQAVRREAKDWKNNAVNREGYTY